MSDEFEQTPENNYSSFWPLLILVSGLLVWSGYQVYATNKQRSVNEEQFQTALPTITEAQNVSTRYVSLMKDLVETAQKDQAAADIVKGRHRRKPDSRSAESRRCHQRRLGHSSRFEIVHWRDNLRLVPNQGQARSCPL